MQCEVIQDLIPLYLDDCCSETSRRLIEEHLEQCAECRKLMQKMGQEIYFEDNETDENIREEKLFRQSKEMVKKEVKTDYMEKAVKVDIVINIGLILYLLHGCIKTLMFGSYMNPFEWEYGNNIFASGIDWACILVLFVWTVCEVVFLKDSKRGKDGVVTREMSAISVVFKAGAIFLCGIASAAVWLAK